ncbi:hypothetical protein NM688_g2047 [Phlebia brevispora]|uniref:Uncharacterized protein n=1 Tax=Phlebia brevispora TaxID=194682 RepID=A0ACC1TA06_9APHY|nr:hypothetical protein NM688_g2047 [Phlebia brevispora]
MSDTHHETESREPPIAAEDVGHTRPQEDLLDLQEAHEAGRGEADAQGFLSTAAEPFFEHQEAPAAYVVHPPTAQPPVPTGELLGGQEMSSTAVEQGADTPNLPPRPPDDHPAWMEASHTDFQPTSTRTTPGDNRQTQEHLDPAIAPLKSMFPDFDDAVLQSVLESVNGSHDAAVDVLLGMSDPTYVSTQHQTTAPTSTVNPSLELDEQLARQLMLEDQRQEQAQHGRWRPQGQMWPRRNSTQQPGQPGQPDQQQQGGQSGERVQELKETFNQIAESGKRTFSSIVSKVKAKINEYEQSRQQGQQPAEPSWGSDSGSGPRRSNDGLSQQPAGYPSYYSPDPRTPNAASNNRAPMDRHATSQAYAQYYTVGSDEDDGWTPVRNKDRRTSGDGGSREVKGYDIGDSPEIPSITSTTTYSPSLPSVTDTQPSPDPSAASSMPDVPRPPPTNAGSPINAAKLGLLPRRPVNLMTSQPTTPTPRQHNDDDDDELDYVENPFEEHRK